MRTVAETAGTAVVYTEVAAIQCGRFQSRAMNSLSELTYSYLRRGDVRSYRLMMIA
jgi:hypothetical protein